tara:strand:- start:11420 stop:11572 length:153 start_codon:yes stop_codon:yes gene_type:complete
MNLMGMGMNKFIMDYEYTVRLSKIEILNSLESLYIITLGSKIKTDLIYRG